MEERKTLLPDCKGRKKVLPQGGGASCLYQRGPAAMILPATKGVFIHSHCKGDLHHRTRRGSMVPALIRPSA